MNTITNEKRGLSQPKVDRTVRKQRSTETRTRRNKAKIEAMNGLENHHYTMQNTLTEGQLKDKFEHGKYERLACTTKEYSETLSRSEGLRVPRREGSVNVPRAQDPYTAVSNDTRPTPRTRVGALSRCHPGHRDTPVGPGRTPTVHWCLYGGRLWVAQAQCTYTTHVVRDPQSAYTQM